MDICTGCGESITYVAFIASYRGAGDFPFVCDAGGDHEPLHATDHERRVQANMRDLITAPLA